MGKLVCYDTDGSRLNHLVQWDKNPTIIIGGAQTSPTPIVHFSNKMSKTSIPIRPDIVSRGLQVKVPSELLQQAIPIDVDMYYEVGDSASTECSISIPVYPRPAPEGTSRSTSYVDTSDANATSSDILNGKTAYVKGSLIKGTLMSSGGIDTSDATATESDVAAGRTAYAKGKQIKGNIVTRTDDGNKYGWRDASLYKLTSADDFGLTHRAEYDVLFRKGSQIGLSTSPSNFGDAKPSDVLNSVSFTSASGIDVAGSLTETNSGDELTMQSSTDIESDGNKYIVKGEVTQDILGTDPNGDNIPGNIIRPGAIVSVEIDKNKFGSATIDQVMEGVSFTSSNGIGLKGTHKCTGSTDWSLANAIESDIASGVKAYSKSGNLITGNIPVIGRMILDFDSVDKNDDQKSIKVTGKRSAKTIITKDGSADIYVPLDGFGEAEEDQVLSGVTFTSKHGFNKIGSLKPSSGLGVGFTSKSGVTTSNVIDTGLSTISYFMLYKGNITGKGLVQCIYDSSTGLAAFTSCTSTTSFKICTADINSKHFSTSSGVFTWKASGETYPENFDLTPDVEYNWIAIGME